MRQNNLTNGNEAALSNQRGLRFDKVARACIARLQVALRHHVPQGKTVFATISAPIRLPAKTVATVTEQIALRLAAPSSPADFGITINGNRIRVRIVSSGSHRSRNVLGFVHNPDVDTTALLNAAQASLRA